MEPMKHTVNLQGLGEGWKGHVIMTAPRNTDRMRAITDLKLHKVKGFEGAKTSEKKAEILFEQQLPMLLDVYEKHAKQLILEVSIVGPNAERIEDVDTFERHPACAECFAEISAAYLEGFGPGKKKGRS